MASGDMIPENRKKKLDSLFEAFSIISEGTYVYLCDMYYDYSRWSKNLVDTFGLPSEYMYSAGSIWEEHIHPEDRAAYHLGIEEVFNGSSQDHDMQYRARNINGEYDYCTCRGVVIEDEFGQPAYFGGAIRNLGEQSHVDALTGLRNQYGFFEDVQELIKEKTPSRIIVFGIGKLTEINEVYGYHIGNNILQQFGRYLMEQVGRRSGTYRLDGAKFAVITGIQDIESLKDKYEKLRSHFREGLRANGTFVSLEMNAGTLQLKDFNTDDQTVYACLNFAYDESKINRHGDMVEFHENMNDEGKKQIEKLHMIRNSISQKDKGFFLLYQPVIDAETEELIGAEALLRWENSEYGMIPPDIFIPLLEKDPLFPTLGEWILKTALESAGKVHKLLPDFIVNVNLSYAQIEKPDFVDVVRKVLRETQYPPEKLCLEVTERCRLLDVELLRNVMVSLKAGGVKIALDDFGTGFSSVGLLKDLPFDIIKIDRGFVQKIEDDDKERKLVNHFTEVASTFGADVCVEGIETVGMRDILRKYCVHSFQGYYYSRPIPMEKLLSELEKGPKCFAK